MANRPTPPEKSPVSRLATNILRTNVWERFKMRRPVIRHRSRRFDAGAVRRYRVF
jgi:hypothetical protein